MRAEIFETVDDVPDALWAASAPADFFFSRAFMEVMERSRVEDARYRYVVLHEGGEPVGLAVLSRFMLRLDLLSGDRWVARARRCAPRLLDVPLIACGIPASLGQHHLHVDAPTLRGEAVRCVDSCMEAWAREQPTALLAWKEWSADQGIRDLVRARGYEALPTLPDHALTDLPGTVEEFLGTMRSSYRRKYKQALALMQGDGPLWTSGRLRLEDGPFTVDVADEFNRGYLSLMDRATTRLETYPPTFFRGLARSSLDTRALRLSNEENGESLTALMIASGDVIAFALVAKDRAEYEDALYSVLLRCIALYAVKGGFRDLRMGQTSSYAKCAMGARPRRLETYMRVRGRLRHAALVRYGSVLFPEDQSPALSVYKDA